MTIVRIQGDKVRIGVEAPNDVRILRRELEVTSLESTRLPNGVRVEQNRRAA